jgi:hypothetical protein
MAETPDDLGLEDLAIIRVEPNYHKLLTEAQVCLYAFLLTSHSLLLLKTPKIRENMWSQPVARAPTRFPSMILTFTL